MIKFHELVLVLTHSVLVYFMHLETNSEHREFILGSEIAT